MIKHTTKSILVLVFVGVMGCQKESVFVRLKKAPPAVGGERVAVDSKGNIRSLNVNGVDLDVKDWVEISKLKKIESVLALEAAVSDEILAVLSGVDIKALSISGSFSNEGLEHLAKMASLSELSVGRSKITSVGMKSLAQLEHLEILALYEYEIEDKDLDVLRNAKGLRVLLLMKPSRLSRKSIENFMASRRDVKLELGVD